MEIMNDSLTKLCFSEKTCIYDTPVVNYSFPLLDFEKNFDYCQHFEWMAKYWQFCYVFIAVYLLAIYFGQNYMKSRPPFKLRGALLFWNLFLGTFSAFGAWRTISVLAHQMSEDGFHEAVCGNVPTEVKQGMGIYMWYFAISKFFELLDTAFIVLRKSPLIFLHWYHHMTVCFFVWSSGAYPSNIQMYFCAINLLVHAVMYTYYALKVANIRVPKQISMVITSMQLIQMLCGVYLTAYSYRMKTTPGIGCCIRSEAFTIAVTIYSSYFLLFLNFFVRAYVFKKSKKSDTVNGTFKKDK